MQIIILFRKLGLELVASSEGKKRIND